MRALLCLCVSLLSVTWAGCTSSSSATELTLTITSDLTVPDQLDRVTVSVVGQEVTDDPTADLRDKPLPRSLTLVHDSGPLGPLQITVRGWSGSQLVVQKDLQAWFLESAHAVLAVQLESACREMLCSTGMTCEQGHCVPVSGGSDGGIAPHDAMVGPEQDASRADAQRPAPDAAPAPDGATDAAADGSATPPVPDASTQPDAGAPDTGVPVVPDAGPPPVSGGAPPVCTLSLPAIGDSYQVNALVALRGSCSDPETGPLTAGLSWASQLDGPLGAGGTLDVPLRTVGAHHLTLCASDPRDSSLVGCSAVDVTVTLFAQPTATITAITQSGSATLPFSAASGIAFTGVGTGAGVTLSWTDDLAGALGNGASVALDTPLVGRHSVTLTATDRNGVARTALRLYVVVAAGETNLFSPFTTVNTTLDTAGDPGVTMIASDPLSRAYVPNSSGVLYRFDGNSLSSPAPIAIGQPPLLGVVQDAQLVVEKNMTYLATTQGLTVCSYNALAGVAEPCLTYGRGPAMQSINVLSVLRMSAGAMPGPLLPMDVLLEGTDNGVFIPDAVVGSTRGAVLL
ncbi:MAG: hypothetical protein JWN04_4474, partial [Myxococcaceae bacterium]|nr:hypothetical protein [Myxococcaceae bacterium]